MSQGGILEVGVDLLDDRVSAVGFVRGDGVQGAGREERVEPPRVEQGGLPGNGFGVEVRYPADDEAAQDLLTLLPRGERGEADLGDLGAGDPPSGWSSNTAFGYLIVVHASVGIVAITALMCLVCRTVIDTAAFARRAAARTLWP